MIKSAIEWTNDTWNPWHGCTKISPGCKNCYMYRDKKRYGQDPMKIVRAAKSTFESPLRKLNGPLVFTCSWSDFFIEEADPWRGDAWRIIKETPHLTYQILTKRPQNIPGRLPKDWHTGYPNVWLGVSIESQDYVWRAQRLLEIPSAIRFISAEPLLGALELDLQGFDWVITGGESGPGYRLSKDEWFKSIFEQCHAASVLHFHKQNGGTKKIDGVWGGKRMSDGQIHQEIPSISFDRSLTI